MNKYNLDHLTQESKQNVWGPIQDDEALFIYSIIRGCRITRILELGGLNGYSAKNFIKAMNFCDTGVLYTLDIRKVNPVAGNHKIITKDIKNFEPKDIDHLPLEMIFFDCHSKIQFDLYKKLTTHRLINDETILVLHDTNLHYRPFQKFGKFISEENGYAHQPIEREMVNLFKIEGYDVFLIKTDESKHSVDFPIRHGVAVCRKFKPLSF